MTRCESYPPCFGTIYFPTSSSNCAKYSVFQRRLTFFFLRYVRLFSSLHKIPPKQSQAYKCDHCKNSSDPKYHIHLIAFAAHQTGDRRCAKGCKYDAEHDEPIIFSGVLHSENRACQRREASHDASVAAVHQNNSNRYCQGS